jgi:hypothetical protein
MGICTDKLHGTCGTLIDIPPTPTQPKLAREAPYTAIVLNAMKIT